MGSTVIDQRKLGIVAPVARGKWEAKTVYQKLNIVTHNFGTYIAKKSSINVRPTIDENWENYWMELASGMGISTTIINYAVSDTGAMPPEEGWVSSIPSTITQGKFLWSKTVTTYTDNSSSTVYSVAYQGQNPSIKIGKVTTVAPDHAATVKNVGTALDMVLDIEIPQGVTGARLDDVTISESPLAGALPRYNDAENIKSSKPILNNDCVRLVDLAALILKGEISAPLSTSDGKYLAINGKHIYANIKVCNS